MYVMYVESCKQKYTTNFVRWIVNGTSSGSYSVVGIGINEAEPLDLANRQFIKIKIQ
jgi:hypothetical protein